MTDLIIIPYKYISLGMKIYVNDTINGIVKNVDNEAITITNGYQTLKLFNNEENLKPIYVNKFSIPKHILANII